MDSNPAEELVGTVIEGRWVVEERLNQDITDTTGGFFSVGYRVKDQNSGDAAFLKVINLKKAITLYALEGVPTAEALNRVTDSHLFEVQLAEICRNRKMDRIIRVLDHGDIPAEIPLLGTVGLPYIIFENGDCDTHTLLATARRHDIAWLMRTLHHAAVGIMQLHSEDIAHQDVKRSNLVFFGEQKAKLIDLGRAVKRDRPSRNDKRAIPCQWVNAPPELLYRYVPLDWDQSHFAADLYMLGSLGFSMFFDTTMTTAILERVAPQFRPFGKSAFGGPYADALQALKQAFAEVLSAIEPQLNVAIRDDFIGVLRLLCNPDPVSRGHPRDHATKHGRRYSAERFVSAFARLHRKAEIG
jgi:eukaryotic-like serine/threonine-protein kinase